MIVQVKTLEGRLFKVEAAPEASIKAVKDIIETSQPELKAAMMKLIHSGKVLKDDETGVTQCGSPPGKSHSTPGSAGTGR